MEIKEAFQNIRTITVAKYPFLGSVLRKLRVVLDDSLPHVAGVDERNVLYINPKLFTTLSSEEMIYTTLHEVGHVILGHPLRCRSKQLDHAKYNIASDCATNELLRASRVEGMPKGAIKAEDISKLTKKPKDIIKKMTAEEIYNLLPDPIPDFLIPREGKGDLLRGERKPGEVIQEGDPDLYEEKEAGTKLPDEERERKWKQKIAEAYMSSKLAGNLPGSLEEILDKIFQPKIDWRTVIKQYLTNGMGKVVVSTWQRVSRKHTDLPGTKRLTVPRVWALIDTSGSIGVNELRQFLGEVYGMCQQLRTQLNVILWDAKVQGEFRVTKPSDVERIKITGRGGTVIRPALEKAIKSVRYGDSVVILSDWEIFDLNEPQTKELLSKLESRGNLISVTTYGNPTHGKVVRLTP